MQVVGYLMVCIATVVLLYAKCYYDKRNDPLGVGAYLSAGLMPSNQCNIYIIIIGPGWKQR